VKRSILPFSFHNETPLRLVFTPVDALPQRHLRCDESGLPFLSIPPCLLLLTLPISRNVGNRSTDTDGEFGLIVTPQ